MNLPGTSLERQIKTSPGRHFRTSPGRQIGTSCDVKAGRSQDGQIGSVGTSWGQIFAGWVIILKTSIANFHKWITSMTGHSAYDSKLLYLEKLSLYNKLKVRSCTFSIFCDKVAKLKCHTRGH